MLKVTNLYKKYGSLEVLKGINFEVKESSIYGFLGENGAGKTTTMNIITGLIGFDSGEIYIDGENLLKSKRELVKRIGYLPQNPTFYNYMNAYEYLKFIGNISGMPEKLIKSRTSDLLEIVKLKDAAKRRVGGYSGGMKQRFGIAVSMLNNPKLLVLDEPTSALDPEGRMEVLELIKSLKEQGITIFLSTHILNDVERICDCVSIIDSGRIIVSDALEDLKSKYIQPIYDIEFENCCPTNLYNSLLSLSWISNISIEKNKMSIFVSNMEIAKAQLIQLISTSSNPIVSFNLRKSTLEDIFLRLVNTHENI